MGAHLSHADLIVHLGTHVQGACVAVDCEVQVVAVARGVAGAQIAASMSGKMQCWQGVNVDARKRLELDVRAHFSSIKHAL